MRRDVSNSSIRISTQIAMISDTKAIADFPENICCGKSAPPLVRGEMPHCPSPAPERWRAMGHTNSREKFPALFTECTHVTARWYATHSAALFKQCREKDLPVK